MGIALASQGVFFTVQGEGLLLGTPMVFVRLAGCNVNCPECDTDYRFARRVSVRELARLVMAAAPSGVSWVWVTGGEPQLQRDRLHELYAELRPFGYRFAVATSGTLPVASRGDGGPDFVSVSPHRIDSTWVHRAGDQLNAVVGLNGMMLSHLDRLTPADTAGFAACYATPAHGGAAPDHATISRWVADRPGWRVGIQAHRVWGIP